MYANPAQWAAGGGWQNHFTNQAGEGRCTVTQKGIHPGVKTPGRRHQKSKTGILVAPRKGLMSSIYLKKSFPSRMYFTLYMYLKGHVVLIFVNNIEIIFIFQLIGPL